MGPFEITDTVFSSPLENVGFLIVCAVLTVLTTTNLLLCLTKIQGLNCDAATGSFLKRHCTKSMSHKFVHIFPIVIREF
jgi:hypothetical protein